MPLVQDVMTVDPLTVSDQALIDVAIESILANDVSALAVVDAEGSMVGVISEYDVLELYQQSTGEDRRYEPVAKFMTSQVRTISKDASMEIAANIFRAASIRRLFVVDGSRPVGILSRRDVVRHIRDKRCHEQTGVECAASR